MRGHTMNGDLPRSVGEVFFAPHKNGRARYAGHVERGDLSTRSDGQKNGARSQLTGGSILMMIDEITPAAPIRRNRNKAAPPLEGEAHDPSLCIGSD